MKQLDKFFCIVIISKILNTFGKQRFLKTINRFLNPNLKFLNVRSIYLHSYTPHDKKGKKWGKCDRIKKKIGGFKERVKPLHRNLKKKLFEVLFASTAGIFRSEGSNLTSKIRFLHTKGFRGLVVSSPISPMSGLIPLRI